jgi:hypothetical protein
MSIGSSAMCDFPSDPLYTRKIFGIRITSQGIEWPTQYGHDGGTNVKEVSDRRRRIEWGVLTAIGNVIVAAVAAVVLVFAILEVRGASELRTMTLTAHGRQM